MNQEIKNTLADLFDNYPVDDVVRGIAAGLAFAAVNADSDFQLTVNLPYGVYTVTVEKVDAEPNT